MELVIAIALMAVVALGAVVFDVSSHKFFSSSERKTAVLNDLALVLDSIHKDVTIGATSYPDDPANTSVAWYPSIEIWPSANCPVIDTMEYRPQTPSGPVDHIEKIYAFWNNPAFGGCPSSYGCAYSHSVSVQEIATLKFALLTQRLVGINGGSVDNGCLRINSLVMRYDPNLPADNSTNPEVKAENIIFCPRQTSW